MAASFLALLLPWRTSITHVPQAHTPHSNNHMSRQIWQSYDGNDSTHVPTHKISSVQDMVLIIIHTLRQVNQSVLHTKVV